MSIDETAYIIYKTLGRGQEQNATSVINAIKQRVSDCVNQQTQEKKELKKYVLQLASILAKPSVKFMLDKNELDGIIEILSKLEDL